MTVRKWKQYSVHDLYTPRYSGSRRMTLSNKNFEKISHLKTLETERSIENLTKEKIKV